MALGPVPPEIRSEALSAELNLCRMVAEPADVTALAREAVALARAAGDPRREVRALIALGSNDPSPEGLEHLLESVALAESIPYPWARATARDNIATRYVDEGRWKEALALFREALAERAETDPEGVVYVHLNVAELELLLGRPVAGLEHARRAVAGAARYWPSSAVAGWAHSTLAMIAVLVGERTEALRSLVDGWAVAASSEAVTATRDLLVATAVVFEPSDPELAVRAGAAGLRHDAATDFDPRRNPVLQQAMDRLRHRLGDRRFEEVAAPADLTALVAAATAAPRAALDAAVRGRAEYGTLTPRELDVLRLVVLGRTDQDIGAALHMSPKTASVHVANLKSKLGAESRIDVAVRGRELLADERS
jgi:DNA-binding NarL/FixJ family response regulator